ncbi:MAG TPA: amidohydrolase family protein [Ilumatobacteraceae bacterium]|nr:amidohydrolase family protein [Ilumatobacteraceae bacterium]
MAMLLDSTATAPTRYRLISSDDHVNLDHASIKACLATKFHSDYDQALMDFGASMGALTSSKANAQWSEQRGVKPSTSSMGGNRNHPAFGRPGHTDPVARLADMDADGVEASASYCEVSAFRYLYLLRNGAQEATRAFNTALAEFASADPARLIVSYQIPIHDIDAAVAEVQWVAASGGKSIQLPVFPNELGLPDYWHDRYDPLWAAIQETDLPICCHIGLNTMLDNLAQRDPTPQKGIFVPMTAMSTGEALGMWIVGGVFERFPKLKVVFVEPGVGWVAWWLFITDDLQARQGYEFPAISRKPSEYFHQNVYITFIDEPNVLRYGRERLGVKNLMWSSDYPHPVSSWPHSQRIVDEMFADEDPTERDLVLYGNAQRVWNL